MKRRQLRRLTRNPWTRVSSFTAPAGAEELPGAVEAIDCQPYWTAIPRHIEEPQSSFAPPGQEDPAGAFHGLRSSRLRRATLHPWPHPGGPPGAKEVTAQHPMTQTVCLRFGGRVVLPDVCEHLSIPRPTQELASTEKRSEIMNVPFSVSKGIHSVAELLSPLFKLLGD